jgi:DNA (cytosine-5)-methyltransferase 1
MLENVKGIMREHFRPYFEYVLRQLTYPSLECRKGERWDSHSKRLLLHDSARGTVPEYHVTVAALNAADFGVPQVRHRVFVVATRPDVLPPYDIPEPSHSRAALVAAQRNLEYWESRGLVPSRGATSRTLSLDDHGTKPWVTVRDAIAGLPGPWESERDSQQNHWSIPGARSYPGHSGSLLEWPAKKKKAEFHDVPAGEKT